MIRTVHVQHNYTTLFRVLYFTLDIQINECKQKHLAVIIVATELFEGYMYVILLEY